MAEKKKSKTSRAGSGSGGASKRLSGSPMDVSLLEQIVQLMAANDLNTVDVREGDKRVILKRGQAVVAMTSVPAVASAAAPAPSGGASSHAASGGATSPASSGEDESNLVPIASPMPGTFYASAKPGEKAFVAVGSRVVKDETDVCIIEAMKTFNTHKSDVTGTIAKILVQNGQTVQFDQPLFLVKPD